MVAWWWFWLVFVLLLLVAPVGYGWGYRRWGFPLPNYVRRRRANYDSARPPEWGIAADFIWIVFVGAISGFSSR